MTIEIPLTQGRIALIDDEDLPLVEVYRWYARKQNRGIDLWYAMTNRPQVNGVRPSPAQLLMHRVILGVTDRRVMVDHRNHDGLDNRRSNLRTGTQSHNNANQRKRSRPASSQFKGVYWSSTYGTWISEIQGPHGRRYLGRFPDEVSAALAYDAAAAELFGEFAHLNNPERR